VRSRSRNTEARLSTMRRGPSEWIGMDLYDFAERGAVDRCLSRPLFIRTRSMEHWMSLGADTEQETTEVSEDPLEREGSVFVWYRYAPSSGNDEGLDGTFEPMLALGQTTGSVDVLGTSRWGSIVRGWGDLAFVRNVSLANRAAHIIDRRLFVNDQPGAIVRTSPKTTEHRPIVIVVPSSTGRPFDDEALVARILSCIDLGIDGLQDLALLCVVPHKTKEMVAALNDMLHAIQDILRYRGIEVGSVSIDELDMGYWIKVTAQKSFWHEQRRDHQVPHVVEADREYRAQGVAEVISSTENANVVIPPSGSDSDALVEGLVRS